MSLRAPSETTGVAISGEAAKKYVYFTGMKGMEGIEAGLKTFFRSIKVMWNVEP